MKATITLFIHQKPGEPQKALTVDMSAYPASFGACIGTRIVEVEFEPITHDETATEIAAIEARLTRERADFAAVEQHHLARIASLRAATRHNGQ